MMHRPLLMLFLTMSSCIVTNSVPENKQFLRHSGENLDINQMNIKFTPVKLKCLSNLTSCMEINKIIYCFR